jgi:NitT/TauT family transport system substrate-binding protein
VDAGAASGFSAGGPGGGVELCGSDRLRAVRDLQGTTVAGPRLGSTPQSVLASIGADSGLDPRPDLAGVPHPPADARPRRAAGALAACRGFPPRPQALRAQQLGPVLVTSLMDRPWSHDFGGRPVGNRAFGRPHPIAPNRWRRALRKATDVCARAPAPVARCLVDQGAAERDAYPLPAGQESPADQWRADDPEDPGRV